MTSNTMLAYLSIMYQYVSLFMYQNLKLYYQLFFIKYI